MYLLAVVLEMLQAVARLAESQRYSEGWPWCGGAGGRPGSARPATLPAQLACQGPYKYPTFASKQESYIK